MTYISLKLFFIKKKKKKVGANKGTKEWPLLTLFKLSILTYSHCQRSWNHRVFMM